MKHEHISPENLQQVLENLKPLLIDVREQDEWDLHHISGATLLPLATLATKIEQVCQNRSQPIYLYCQHGRRSHQAALVLLSLGYLHVIELEGGISHWLEKGLPCQMG